VLAGVFPDSVVRLAEQTNRSDMLTARELVI
jgi:hypothetical protein